MKITKEVHVSCYVHMYFFLSSERRYEMKGLKKMVSLIICILFTIPIFGCSKEEGSKKQLESDSYNPWRYTSTVVSADDGYYLATYEDNLCYYDIASNQLVPLCSKPDCEHDTTTCNSYFSGIALGKIMPYDNKLYIAALDNRNALVLYQIDKDGENRKEICILYQGGYDADLGAYINICGGYVYYSMIEFGDSGENTSKLYRKKIADNSKEEFLYENQEDISCSFLSLMHEFNGILYFTDIYTLKSDTMKTYGKLYAYNLKSNKLSVESDDISRNFFIHDNKVYYQNLGETIKTYDLTTKEKKEFCTYDSTNPRLDISFDGQYVYADNIISCQGNDYSSRKITVYDLNGKIVDEIVPLHKDCECLFGDERNLVIKYMDIFYFFDKKQIGTDEEEWTTVYPNAGMKEFYESNNNQDTDEVE